MILPVFISLAFSSLYFLLSLTRKQRTQRIQFLHGLWKLTVTKIATKCLHKEKHLQQNPYCLQQAAGSCNHSTHIVWPTGTHQAVNQPPALMLTAAPCPTQKADCTVQRVERIKDSIKKPEKVQCTLIKRRGKKQKWLQKKHISNQYNPFAIYLDQKSLRELLL